MIATMTGDSVQVVLRLRTLGPSGLNPPQTEIIDRLQTLSEEGLIADLDTDVWGASMGVTQTDERDLVDTRETVAEYKQWADEQGSTLRPAFDWDATEGENSGEEPSGRIVTPLITLAVYTQEGLQEVHPHIDGDEVNTIRDGVGALESMAEPDPGDADAEHEQSEDETRDDLRAPLP
jgi:hypothetical protein